MLRICLRDPTEPSAIVAPTALLTAIALSFPAPLTAQTDGVAAVPEAHGTASMSCWGGRPLPECGGFFVVEMTGVMPFAQTMDAAAGRDVEPFETRLEWNLGYMGNLDSRWALGGALSVGTGAERVLTGVKARARRWLGPELSLEADLGLLRQRAWFHGSDVSGLTADVRFNVADKGALFVRWDGVTMPTFTFHDGSEAVRGFKQSLSIGAGAGSSWAVGSSVLLGVTGAALLVILLATVGGD